MMFKKEKTIDIDKLNDILDSSIKEAINKMESVLKEKRDDVDLFAFSLQNLLAMQEYKGVIKEKLKIDNEEENS